MRFSLAMIYLGGVPATPGIDFDRSGGNRYVRFSYAGRRETIERALERMSTFLK